MYPCFAWSLVPCPQTVCGMCLECVPCPCVWMVPITPCFWRGLYGFLRLRAWVIESSVIFLLHWQTLCLGQKSVFHFNGPRKVGTEMKWHGHLPSAENNSGTVLDVFESKGPFASHFTTLLHHGQTSWSTQLCDGLGITRTALNPLPDTTLRCSMGKTNGDQWSRAVSYIYPPQKRMAKTQRLNSC